MGIYVNSNAAGGTRGDALVDQLVAAGGNTVVDVKDRMGRLSYTRIEAARAIGASKEATIDHPAEVVRSWRIAVCDCSVNVFTMSCGSAASGMAPLSRQGRRWSERGTPNGLTRRCQRCGGI